MTFAKLTTILSFTAALAAASPVLAAANTNVDDSHGVNSIGIDIRGAGGSPQAIQAFLSKLSPETVRGVVAGCQTAVNNPNTYPEDVQSFCVGVNQIGGSVQQSALGFAAPAKAPLFAPLMSKAPAHPDTSWTGGSPGGSGPAY